MLPPNKFKLIALLSVPMPQCAVVCGYKIGFAVPHHAVQLRIFVLSRPLTTSTNFDLKKPFAKGLYIFLI
jgi:hypothetical protein